MTTYFLDTFTGSGALSSHTPDTAFPGGAASWSMGAGGPNPKSGSVTLSGGVAVPSPTGGAYTYGTSTTGYTVPGVGTLGFAFTTGSIGDITDASHFQVGMNYDHVNYGGPPSWTYYSDYQWMLEISNYGGTDHVRFWLMSMGSFGSRGDIDTSFTLAPHTRYTGVVTINSAGVTVTIDTVMSANSPWPMDAGYGNPSQIGFAVGAGGSMDHLYYADAPITVGGVTPFVPWWKNYRLTSES